MNKHIDLLKRQVIQLLKEKKIKFDNITFIDIRDGYIKIMDDKKFIMYLDVKVLQNNNKQSKQLTQLRDNLAKKILTGIKKAEKISNIICLIPVSGAHNLIDKCVESLKKQTMLPQIILIISSDVDKKFAINRNVEFIKVNKNILGYKYQSGLNFIKINYPMVYGIILCTGTEMFTKNYIKDCKKKSIKFDIVGKQEDYIISSFNGDSFNRIINQQKYRDILTRKYRNDYVIGSGRFIMKRIFDKLNWKVFSEQDNDTEINSFSKLCQSGPLIGIMDSSSILNIYQGTDFDQYIKSLKNKGNYNLEKVINLSGEEQNLFNRIVVKSVTTSPKGFLNTKIIKPTKDIPDLKPTRIPVKVKTNPTPIKKKEAKRPVNNYNNIDKNKPHSRINDYFDRVFVINLERDTDRLKTINNKLKSLNINYERLPGVDGENPAIQRIFKTLRGSRIGSANAYGKLLSHIKVIEICRKRGYDNVLILEDDINFISNFNINLNKLYSLPTKWDIIYLGYSDKLNKDYQILKGFYSIAQNNSGTFAYGINKSCFNIILSLWKKKDYSVDHALKILQEKNNSYVLADPIIYSNSKNVKKENNKKQKKNTSIIPVKKQINFTTSDKISIVIPTYNGFPLIKRCINSIINQSFSNWELILINDGSSDQKLVNYLNYIKSWKIKVYHLPKNMGLPYALNRGIEKCTGNYWTWISDDNEFTSECLEQLKEQLDKGYQFVYSNFYFINELDEEYNKNKVYKLENYDYKSIITDWRGMACYMWKMNSLKKIGKFDENLQGIEDYDFVIRTFILLHGSTKYLNKTLFLYYRRNNTITTRLGDKLDQMKDTIHNKYINSDMFIKIFNIFKNFKELFLFISNNNDIYRINSLVSNISKYIKSFIISTKISELIEEDVIYIERNIFNQFLEIFKLPKTNIILYYDEPRLYKYIKLLKPKMIIFDVINIESDTIDHTMKLGLDKANIITCQSNHIKNTIQTNYNTKNVRMLDNNNNDFIRLLKGVNKKEKFVFKIGLVGNFLTNDFNWNLIKKNLMDSFPSCKFINLSDLSEYPYFTPKILNEKLKLIDFIFITGNVIKLNDCSSLFWNKQFLKKPVYLFNVSIDYKSLQLVDNLEIKKLLSFLSNQNIKYISVKNKITKDWIDSHISINKNITVSEDICFNKKFNSFKSKKQNKILGIIISQNNKINDINNLCTYAIEKGYQIHYIESTTNGMVKNINLINDLLFQKKIITGDNVDDIIYQLSMCDIIYSDQYYPCLIGLLLEIKTVCLNDGLLFENLYNSFGCIDWYTHKILKDYINMNFEINEELIKSIKEDVKLGLDKFKKTLIKNHIKIIHFGSYWQKDNDIIKLMVNDLLKVCNTTEIDVQIYKNINRENWFDNIELDNKNYPNKYVRYLKENKLKELIDNENPNIIITNSGGLTFTDDSFEFLNNRGIITIGLSMSDPDVFPYNGKFYSSKYDYFYTNSLVSLNTQYDINTNIELLPFACSTVLHKPMNIIKNYDIVVVGGCRPDRVIVIDELKKHFNVGVFGSGWPKSYNAIKVNGKDHVEALNKGNIYISFGLTVAGFTNVKVGLFEAAACKLVLVTDRTNEITKYFDEDKEVILYSSINELIEKIKNLLGNKFEMSMLKQRSYKRFIKDHTWENRWSDILLKII